MRGRGVAFIKMVEPEEADEALKAVYAEVAGKRGSVSNVLKIHSLKPATMKTHLDLYLSILFAPSGLSRREREAIAVVVSRTNGCSYCVAHHAEAYGRYQKDAGVVEALASGGTTDGLTAREGGLIAYAVDLTKAPAADPAGRVERLRRHGFDDEEILTATMTVAYFNFVNRMVHGLGVEMETAPGHYKY